LVQKTIFTPVLNAAPKLPETSSHPSQKAEIDQKPLPTWFFRKPAIWFRRKPEVAPRPANKRPRFCQGSILKKNFENFLWATHQHFTK
jgi:hypothetical protein